MTLQELIKRDGIRATSEWTGENKAMAPDAYATQQEKDWYRAANHFKVTLKGQPGRRMSVAFSQGSGISGEPTADGVLECLLSDASSADEEFINWAGDLGYDPDSRKAERIYNAVKKQTAKLKQFLGDSFEEYINADRD